MPHPEPVIETMKASDARQNFSQVLNEVFRGEKRVLVEKSGIPVAGIVSARDLERLRDLDEQRERDFAVIDVIRDAFADVSDEEIEREVARAVASARQKRRLKAERGSESA